MPYKSEWVPADVYLTHKNVNIYHVYRYNDIENGKREYHFSLSQDSDDNPSYSNDPTGFDVRDLESWPLAEGSTEEEKIKDALIRSIESYELSPELVKE